MSRSTEFEALFVDEAARQAGYAFDGFQDHVAQRLAEGARLYDDRAIRAPLHELARELAEEGRDLATWSALAAQCDEIARMDTASRERITARLLRIATLGALVEREVQQLRDEIGE